MNNPEILPINFVTIYFVTREFGGYEEGGWWFDWHKKVASFDVRGLADDSKERLIDALDEYYEWLHGDDAPLYSVTSTGKHYVFTEEEEGELETHHRPRYE